MQPYKEWSWPVCATPDNGPIVIMLTRSMTGELLRAQFSEMALWNLWRRGGPSALCWAIEHLPEDLWARGMLCPAERAVMLGAWAVR